MIKKATCILWRHIAYLTRDGEILASCCNNFIRLLNALEAAEERERVAMEALTEIVVHPDGKIFMIMGDALSEIESLKQNTHGNNN